MAKDLLLYSGGGMLETEAEQAEVKKACEASHGELGGAVVDGGNPFTPVAKHVSSDGTVGDGPVGAMASGYAASRQSHSTTLPANPWVAQHWTPAARFRSSRHSRSCSRIQGLSAR
jgi:hypothetical protein